MEALRFELLAEAVGVVISIVVAVALAEIIDSIQERHKGKNERAFWRYMHHVFGCPKDLVPAGLSFVCLCGRHQKGVAHAT